MGVRSELYEIFSGCSPFDPNVNPNQPIRGMKLSKILAMTAVLSSAHLNADPQSPFVPKGTETDEAEANRQAQTLFMGVHPGMDEQEIHTFAKSLTFPVDGLWHSGAPKGEKLLELRTESNPQARVLFYMSHGSVHSVTYWKLGEGAVFTADERKALTEANHFPNEALLTVYQPKDGMFEVAYPEQYVLEVRTGER